jgi:hypothetical protein
MDPNVPPPSSPPPPPPRLRLQRVESVPSPDGYARVRVVLDLKGTLHVGESQGVLTREGDLRTGAEATLRAVTAATGGRLRLGLIGIKAVRAFDSWIVIASVEARGPERHYKLIGARATEAEDMVQGAATAILDALNRVVELHLP